LFFKCQMILRREEIVSMEWESFPHYPEIELWILCLFYLHLKVILREGQEHQWHWHRYVSVPSLLWFEYEMPPCIHVLNLWSLSSGTIWEE
jgi:hypothetical protein